MRDAEASKQLRVLAFGDSLTEGWIQIARVKHPYTWNLEKRLRDKLAPRGVAVTVTNAGGRAARRPSPCSCAPPRGRRRSAASL